jgi:serine/threonine-protein kinase
MGTPEYMSPEQVSGEVVDQRTDLYSLAISAYEMFAGEVPFIGNTPELIVAHAQKTPPDLPVQSHGLPEGLVAVLHKALAKNPDDRFASCLAFSMAIDAAFAELPANTTASSMASAAPEPNCGMVACAASPKMTTRLLYQGSVINRVSSGAKGSE